MDCCIVLLTLKALITTAADDIHKYFFIVFSEKIRLDVSCESSARQRIHSKHQVLFSSKDKSKKLKCRLLQFLFSALRVKKNSFRQLNFLSETRILCWSSKFFVGQVSLKRTLLSNIPTEL